MPVTFPVKGIDATEPPLQTTLFVTAFTVGVGLTVISNVLDVPTHRL